jgi:hypothetical protein
LPKPTAASTGIVMSPKISAKERRDVWPARREEQDALTIFRRRIPRATTANIAPSMMFVPTASACRAVSGYAREIRAIPAWIICVTRLSSNVSR